MVVHTIALCMGLESFQTDGSETDTSKYRQDTDSVIPDEKPEWVELDEEEEWDDLSYDRKYYHINKEEHKRRKAERKRELQDWLTDLKAERGCSECDEDHPACLDFHHLDEDTKTDTVSRMVSDGYGKKKLLEEMEKCILLCANCHRKHHN